MIHELGIVDPDRELSRGPTNAPRDLGQSVSGRNRRDAGDRLAAYLPYHLGARRGVGAAERWFPQIFIVEMRDLPAPDIEVHQIVAILGPDHVPRARAVDTAVGLAEERDYLVVLAQDTIHIVSTTGDVEVVTSGRIDDDTKSVTLVRTTRLPQQISRPGLDPMQQDIGLLVPVRVELHPPLLHTNALVVFMGPKGPACEITLHEFVSSSA